MSCQCHQIGGPFIAEDPNCPIHGQGSTFNEEDFRRWFETHRISFLAEFPDVPEHNIESIAMTAFEAAWYLRVE